MAEMEGELYSLIPEDEGSIVDNSVEVLYHGPHRMVWLAVRDGRRIVYKGLPEQLRNHPEEIAALRKEYLLGLHVEHEGVVRTYGFEHHSQLGPVIVMEYVDGITLEAYIKKAESKSAPNLKERKRIASEIAEALKTIHQKGIAHRDLKPDNILIRKKDRAVKIIDFGHGDSEEFAIYKTSLGTSQYGAPEQQTPSRGGMESDVYSYGRILQLLLPERSFKTIRDACLQLQPSLRPDMQQVVRRLSRKCQSRVSKRLLIGGLISVIIIIVGVSWLGWSGKDESSERVTSVDTDTLSIGPSIPHISEAEAAGNQTSNDEKGEADGVAIPTPAHVKEGNIKVDPSEIIMGDKQISGRVDERLDSLFRAGRLAIEAYHKEYYRKLVGFKGAEEEYEYKKGMLQIDRNNDFMKICREFMIGLNNLGLTQSQWIEESKKFNEIMNQEKDRIDQLVEEKRQAKQ